MTILKNLKNAVEGLDLGSGSNLNSKMFRYYKHMLP